MDHRDKRILAKMRDEARLIIDFVDGLNVDAFMQSEIMKRAVAMTVANIGELCGVLSDEVKQQY